MTPQAPRECRLCGRWTFWRDRRASTPWICGVCVIPALEPEHLEWLDERPVQTTPQLTGLRFTPAPRRLVRRGLLGWIAFGIGANWRVDGVAIRRTLDGRLVLSFPSRTDRRGREHPYVLPTRGRRQVERAVLAELGLSSRREEPHQLARTTNGIARARALRDEEPDQPASNLDLGGPHAVQGIAP